MKPNTVSVPMSTDPSQLYSKSQQNSVFGDDQFFAPWAYVKVEPHVVTVAPQKHKSFRYPHAGNSQKARRGQRGVTSEKCEKKSDAEQGHCFHRV